MNRCFYLLALCLILQFSAEAITYVVKNGLEQTLNTVAAGDTILLDGGVYNESIVIPKDNIVIMAKQGTSPIISGLDTISEWQLHEGNIYVSSVAKNISQLFVLHNGELEQMVYARYPNLTSDDLFQQTYASASSVTYNGNAKSHIVDASLSVLSDKNLVGAKLWLPYPFDTKWNSATETINKQESDRLEFLAVSSASNLKAGKNTNIDYHLTGVLSLLDAEKEWFYDASTHRLYFCSPDGSPPENLTVLARTRDVGITANKKNGLSIHGLTFLATGLKIKGNKTTVASCNFYYPTPFFHPIRWQERSDISIEGDVNMVKKCEIAHSWGSGMSMRKSTNSTLDNCLIHNCNWSGSISPGAWVAGKNMVASRNTIYSVGRSGIRMYDVYNSLFELNHIFDYGLINHDLGSIKGGLQDYKHSVFRYNFSHDCVGGGPAKAGIYLDASNDSATVHHNVQYGVHLSINGNVNNDSVFNNTLVRPDTKSKIWSHFVRAGQNWDYHSVLTYNNLSTNVVKGTDLQKNKRGELSTLGFVGADYGDMRLLPSSPAIDFGREIGAYTENCIGLPDAGAYEYGDTSLQGNWIAGITWSPDWNILPVADIEIQNTLGNNSFTFSVKEDDDSDGWIMRYDWDFGDGKTSYGKEVEHTYTKKGVYDVVLTLHDNLGGSTSILKQVASSALGGSTIKRSSDTSSVSLFPNPVNSTFSIKSDKIIHQVVLQNRKGQTVRTFPTFENENLDMSQLANGVYFANCTFVNGERNHIKLILQ